MEYDNFMIPADVENLKAHTVQYNSAIFVKQ